MTANISLAIINGHHDFECGNPCAFDLRRGEMFFRLKPVAGKLIFALAFSLLAGQTMAAGALAIDANQGSQYGWAEGYPSTGEATQHALSQCGSGCKIVMRYSSGCGAYAADQSSGSSVFGTGTDSSAGGAQSRAISMCQTYGGTSCTIRAWSCN
jgi:Domain of unknown function (DUF4189)